MVSRLRLCSAIQSARASASATVVIASTSTASFSTKIRVDVIGSKPRASPKGFGRSPTIAFPWAVKTITLSGRGHARALFQSICAVHLELPFDVGANDCSTKDCQKRGDESIGDRIDPYQSIGWTVRSGTASFYGERAQLDLLWGNRYEETRKIGERLLFKAMSELCPTPARQPYRAWTALRIGAGGGSTSTSIESLPVDWPQRGNPVISVQKNASAPTVTRSPRVRLR